MPPLLNNAHKVLIQALLSRGPLAEEELHSIYTGVTGKNPANHKQASSDYLLKINRELSYVNCELRGCRDQNDGKVCYGFVNNMADEESKLGTKYSVPQIAYYRAIIEAIMQDVSAQGSISEFEALNLRLESQVRTGVGSQSQESSSPVPAAFRNFTLSQKERTIEEIVRDRWLYSCADNKIGLGIRSFLDLRSWFRSNGIPSCELCNEAAIKAELCPNENCTARIHEYCMKQKFSQRRVERTCPSCGWASSVPKAEEVEPDDEPVAVQTQPPPRSGKKRVRNGETSKAGPSLSQPAPNVSGLRRTTRRSDNPR